MWNTHTERFKTAQNLWSAAANEILAQKEATIAELNEKLNVLEKDFKYNYNLLKIRGDDQLRLQKENSELNKQLQNKNDEVKILQKQLQRNEEKLKDAKWNYEQDKNKLEILNTLVTEIQNDLNECHKRTEVQTQALAQKDQHISQLTHTLLEIKDEANRLSNEKEHLQRNLKILEKDTEQMKITLHGNEQRWDNVNQANMVLKNENERLKKEQILLTQQLKSQKTHRSDKALSELNKNLTDKLHVLQNSAEEILKRNQELNENYQKLQQVTCLLLEDRNEILKTFKQLKVKNEDKSENSINCNKLLQQNEVLKEVVKKLRQELVKNADSEKKIQHLEERVDLLKSYLNDTSQDFEKRLS